MPTQRDVRRLALALPDVAEATDHFGFSVENKGKQRGFAWAWHERVEPKKPRVERPDVLVVRVANLDVKEGLLAARAKTCFTEPHYNGYPAVLIRLDAVGPDELEDLITDAWAAMAPKALVLELEQERSGERAGAHHRAD